MFLSFILFLAAVIPAADGVPIHYIVEGKGDPALVFVHCWGCDRHLWDNQISIFAKNHRVVAIDLPGHGESGKARKNYSIGGYGDDVKRVVTKLGLKRVVFIGSSMGGPVALEAARLMPERVIAIVPVDTLHNVEERMPAEQIDAMLKQISADYKGETTRLMNQYFFATSTPAAVRDRMLSQATSLPPEMAIRILRAALTYDPIPTLRMIKVPLRAINADLRPTNLENNRKHAPQFEVVIMKGVGHYPMLEDPARFNELLTGVLRDLRSPTGVRSLWQHLNSTQGSRWMIQDPTYKIKCAINHNPINGQLVDGSEEIRTLGISEYAQRKIDDREFAGWEGWLAPADPQGSTSHGLPPISPKIEPCGSAGASHPSQPVMSP